jgi:orotate phosphoribosyltransferase
MQEMEIMDIFTRMGAYQQGHFKLSSGRHSGAYLQCALVLQDPFLASRLCGVLADKFRMDTPDLVIGPAMGGVVLAYEMARALNARAIFTERDAEGNMTLRRGFMVSPENKVLVAEDVLTTGGSVKGCGTSCRRKRKARGNSLPCGQERGENRFWWYKMRKLDKIGYSNF